MLCWGSSRHPLPRYCMCKYILTSFLSVFVRIFFNMVRRGREIFIVLAFIHRIWSFIQEQAFDVYHDDCGPVIRENTYNCNDNTGNIYFCFLNSCLLLRLLFSLRDCGTKSCCDWNSHGIYLCCYSSWRGLLYLSFDYWLCEME